MNVSWDYRPLGEVCVTSAGGTPLKQHKEYYDNGDIPWLLSGEVGQREIVQSKKFITKFGLDNSSAKLFPANTVLIAMYGATAGQVGVLKFEATTNQAVCGILPNENFISDFLYFYFLYQKQELISQAVGNAQPNISQKKVRGTFIPVLPIPEQKRIVAIMDKAFAGIATATANAEKNLQNARELFESYLNSVFTDNGLGWVDTTVGDEVDLLPGFAFKSANYTDADKGVKLLRGDNIMQGALRWDGVKKWPQNDVNDYEKFWLLEGDVVLAMDRPWVNAGLKRAMIETSDLPCLLVQRVARLRAKKGIDCRFLYYMVSSQKYIDRLLGNQTGIGVPHISGKQIQCFGFKKPALTEQIAIGNDLDEMEKRKRRLEAIYQQKLDDLAELKQSILQKAFSGKLTQKAA